ncbi:uncharacterized protein LOC144102392 [Amblyomma americanum]
MATISAASGGIDTSGNSQLSDARVPGLKEATESGDGKGEMSQHGSMAGGENKRALGKPAVAVASRGKAVALAGRNDKLARVPKSPIRMKRKAARKARPRETLVSLAGSPVKSQPVETPVHVHIDNAEATAPVCRQAHALLDADGNGGAWGSSTASSCCHAFVTSDGEGRVASEGL